MESAQSIGDVKLSTVVGCNVSGSNITILNVTISLDATNIPLPSQVFADMLNMYFGNGDTAGNILKLTELFKRKNNVNNETTTNIEDKTADQANIQHIQPQYLPL